VDNRILPLPERARNRTPRGIGQLPEQTLRNTNHIGDDKSSDHSRAARGDRKNFDHAPPTFDLISPNPGQYPLFSFGDAEVREICQASRLASIVRQPRRILWAASAGKIFDLGPFFYRLAAGPMIWIALLLLILPTPLYRN
jgi:hypothetical protein